MSFEALLPFDLVQSEREHILIYGRGESSHGLSKRGSGLDPRWINGGRRIVGGYRSHCVAMMREFVFLLLLL